MSFRNTYITEFLYKHGRDEELETIKKALEEEGTVNWSCSLNDSQLGYFHGVIKDLDGHDTKLREKEIVDKIENAGARIKIVFE